MTSKNSDTRPNYMKTHPQKHFVNQKGCGQAERDVRAEWPHSTHFPTLARGSDCDGSKFRSLLSPFPTTVWEIERLSESDEGKLLHVHMRNPQLPGDRKKRDGNGSKKLKVPERKVSLLPWHQSKCYCTNHTYTSKTNREKVHAMWRARRECLMCVHEATVRSSGAEKKRRRRLPSPRSAFCNNLMLQSNTIQVQSSVQRQRDIHLQYLKVMPLPSSMPGDLQR